MSDLGLFLGLVAVITLVLFAFAGGGNSKQMKQRIARVTGQGKSAKPKSASEIAHPLRKSTESSLPLLARLLGRGQIMAALRTRLERTGRKIPAEKYLMICASLFVVIFFILWLATKSTLLGLFGGIIIGFGIPHIVTGRWARKRLNMFVKLFPDGIDLIVRGLRSGLPVAEGIQVVSREIPEPVSTIFGDIADKVRLGVTLENALKETTVKLRCTEFDFFSTSIILQRETGGNLSEILNNLSDVLRKRFMMQLKIKALSSEARASAYIIGALPFVVLIAVYVMSPGYMDPLFHDDRGQLCALGAATSLITGIGIMVRMTKFEI